MPGGKDAHEEHASGEEKKPRAGHWSNGTFKKQEERVEKMMTDLEGLVRNKQNPRGTDATEAKA